MAGPSSAHIRPPAVAGAFYPQETQECRTLAAQYLQQAQVPTNASVRWHGGIVPHAGWICSGAIAAQTMAALARQGPVDVVVIFAAIHTPLPTSAAALDSYDRWAVPSGQTTIAREIDAKLCETPALFVVDDRFHQREHAVEVELPLVQQAWPHARLLAVEVPASENSVAIGAAAARQIAGQKLSAVFLASSDFTHYGPGYGFVPAGVGSAAMAWAKDNDRRLLDLITRGAVERIVPEVRSRFNACGAGAIAAMMSACREMGAAPAGQVLCHASSYETLAAVAPQRGDSSVGYAAVLVG